MLTPLPYSSYYPIQNNEDQCENTPNVFQESQPPHTSIVIGDFLLEQYFRHLFRSNASITIHNAPQPQSEYQIQQWVRDTQVIPFYREAPFGRGRLPGEVSMIASTTLAQGLFPNSAPQELSKLPIGRIQEELRPPPLSSELCYLEGGNVVFWEDPDRTPSQGAFIGAFSVILSLQKMREKQYFTKERLEESRSQLTTFPQPIPQQPGASAQEQELFSLQWILTLKQIAQELKIPQLTNLIVLEHGLNLSSGRPLLHIDLMLLAGPNQTIFLDEPRQDVSLWENIYPSNSSEHHAWSTYFASLQSNAAKSQVIFENNKARLSNQGFKVVGVQGLMILNKGGIGGQFLNGLLFHVVDRNHYLLLSTPIASPALYQNLEEPHRFITLNNAHHQAHRLAEVFFDQMRQHGIHIVFCSPNNAQGGGVRCLSRVQMAHSDAFPCQLIPVHSSRLATTVQTYVELTLRNLNLLNNKTLTLHHQVDANVEILPLTFQHRKIYYQSLIQLSIPIWQKGSSWTLHLEGKPIGAVHHILPGHPQQIAIDSILTENGIAADKVVESAAKTL